MSLLQISSPLGVVLGYAMTTILVRAKIQWTWAFTISAIILAVYGIAIIFFPSIYFSTSLRCVNQHNVYLKKVVKVKSNNNNAIDDQIDSNSKQENKDEKSKIKVKFKI